MTINCPNCGGEMSEYAYKCPHCGTENENRTWFSNIDINGNYEPLYFSYAKAKKEKADERVKWIIRGLIIAAIIIVIIAVIFAVNRTIQRNNGTREVSVIEDAMSGEVIDGELRASNEMKEYMENGVTLFNSLEGYLQIRTYSDPYQTSDVHKILEIIYEASNITESEKDIALDGMTEIYGSPRNVDSKLMRMVYYWDASKCDQIRMNVQSLEDDLYTVQIVWENNF